jgi:hypothetical protein
MLAAFCVVLLSLEAFCYSRALETVDVELIPEEQRTADVGRSLSLGLDDKKHNFIDVVDDQTAAGSDFYAPVIGNYDELQRKEGESYRLEDVGDARGEVGFYGISRQKGSRAQVSQDGYAADHQAAHGDKLNRGYYDDNSGARKAYDVGRASYGDQAFNRQGQAAAAFGSRGGHRKGHHSSGFKNSYYKDESGNNSRFYDDANDEGGHYLYDARDGAFRDQGADLYRGGYEDGAYQDNARGKQGKYGAAAGYDDSRGYKGRYAQDGYYDDKTGYNQQRGGESFGRNHEAGRLYHTAADGYSRPAVVGGYVTPTGIYDRQYDYYNPKAYHAAGSYPVPYNSFYKDRVGPSGSVDDPIYNGARTGKGYAEYIDTGASNYYSGKGGVINRYDEPSYYSSIN